MDASFKVGAMVAKAEGQEECPQHGPYGFKVFSLGGRDVKSPCPTCQKERDEQRARESLQQWESDRRAGLASRGSARAAEILAAAQIPRRFADKTFDTFVVETDAQRGAMTACRDYAQGFSEACRTGAGLLLAGNMGNGKTHLAAAIMNAIMPARTALYTTVPEIVRAVRDTWRRDSKMSTSQVVEAMRQIDLLVVDEVGMQVGTDGEQVILYDVLDGRYRDCRPTVMITNLDSKAMRAAIGDRLYDRLRETSKRVLFDWDSERPRARARQ